MPSLAEYCEQLCQYFTKLLELTGDQATLYQEMRDAIKGKAWSLLNQDLERMEFLAREQSRISKQILELRTQLQKRLQAERQAQQETPQLLRISEILPLLPSEQRPRIRQIWQELRDSLVRRQSELQVLQHYSQEKQEMIQGFLSALKDDELDRGQVYGRAGSSYQPRVAAPARIFNSEA